jgi:dTDP-4-dehydrorhamnose 3,5-epimerase|tara:strand:- start:31 stop:474 length:444 start_codon:yes stop_codon:yes gene_type:complete
VEDITHVKLEKHDTKDINDQHVNGSLTVVWRDWDKIIEPEPKMVYISSVNPGEIKGPHLHLKRNSYFVCIHGKVVFIIKKGIGEYEEIISSEDNPILVHVPKNVSSAHVNLDNKVSKVMALADIAWKPNDNEMENVLFEDYDWKKWI